MNNQPLFLDDIRNPVDVCEYITNGNLCNFYKNTEWVIVRNYIEFVDHIIKNGLPICISFDHDLADEHYRPSMYNPDGHYSNYYNDGTFKEKTGYDAAKWLVDYLIDNNLKCPQIFCHSMNPVGKQNIVELFNNFNKLYGKK